MFRGKRFNAQHIFHKFQEADVLIGQVLAAPEAEWGRLSHRYMRHGRISTYLARLREMNGLYSEINRSKNAWVVGCTPWR